VAAADEAGVTIENAALHNIAKILDRWPIERVYPPLFDADDDKNERLPRHRAPQIRMLKEPTRRVRFLTREEARRLLAVLPEHLSVMAAFTLATGLRRANVTGLQWTQVDLVRRLAWIHPDQAKARKAFAVPLNAEAVVLIRGQAGKHPTHVFSFLGKPIRQVSTKAWYTALQRAEIEDFRWHDLRHTWASWHVQNGMPLHALQELGGWESSEMVRRYAHFSAEHLAPYADRLCALRVVEGVPDGTNSSQPAIDGQCSDAKS